MQKSQPVPFDPPPNKAKAKSAVSTLKNTIRLDIGVNGVITNAPHGKGLAHYKQKNMVPGGIPWRGDYQVNYVSLEDTTFDDKLLLLDKKRYKVHSVTCQSADYVEYVHFVYKAGDGQVVPGFEMHGSTNLNQCDRKVSFTLAQDEYITRVFGLYQIHIERLGFSTNLGKQYVINSNKSEASPQSRTPFQMNAPHGYHFTGFAANCREHVNALIFELQAIDDTLNAPAKHVIDALYSSIGARVVKFLTVREMTKFFLVSRQASMLRFYGPVMADIALKCCANGTTKVFKYALKVWKKTCRVRENAQTARVGAMLEVMNNKIPNPEARNNFDGWQIIQNGGDGIRATVCEYMTSYQYGVLGFEKPLNQIFSAAVIDSLRAKKGAIVAGAMFRDNAFGAWASLSLAIKDARGNKVKANEQTTSEISQYGTRFTVAILARTFEIADTHSVRFEIGGKDKCNWQGYYGARFCSIFLRYLPIDSDGSGDGIPMSWFEKNYRTIV